MKTSVLKPGLLVSLHTSVQGGVSYSRVEVERDHATDDGARVARWETKRYIPNPQEFEAAGTARGKARATVAGVCCLSTFGLLCPMEKEAELAAAVVEARAIAEAHNAGATLTRVEVFVLVGRIAQNDAEAARAIASEVRELLDQMAQGVKVADVEAIREAANKARALGGMLSPEVAGTVAAAVDEARKAAREIVRRVEKSGEAAATVIAALKMTAIEGARFAFLDLDEGEAVAAPVAPRAVELDDETVDGANSYMMEKDDPAQQKALSLEVL